MIRTGVLDYTKQREGIGAQVVRVRSLNQGHRRLQSELRGSEAHSK